MRRGLALARAVASSCVEERGYSRGAVDKLVSAVPVSLGGGKGSVGAPFFDRTFDKNGNGLVDCEG